MTKGGTAKNTARWRFSPIKRLLSADVQVVLWPFDTCETKKQEIQKRRKLMPGYKLTATIINKSTTVTPPDINLAGIGLRKGVEILDHTSKEGTDTDDLRGRFRGVDKMSPGQKKPMSLIWLPPSDKKAFFTQLKGKMLKVRAFISQYEGTGKWTLTFDDVEILIPVMDEKRKLPNGQFATFPLQRVNFTFKKFIDDPDA